MQYLGNRNIAVWALLFVLAAGRLIAQSGPTGSILGSVVDSTGAVISQATRGRVPEALGSRFIRT